MSRLSSPLRAPAGASAAGFALLLAFAVGPGPVSAQQTGGAGTPAPAAASQAATCFSASEPAQIVAGCDAVLAAARGAFTADQAGLALQRRGGARAALGRTEEALADFRQMQASGYRRHEAYASIASLEFRRQRLAEAEQAYREALKINASYALALAGLGHTLLARGRPAEALAQFDLALATAENDAATHAGKGAAQLANGDADGAIKSFANAIRLDPALLAARYQRAQALSEKGDHAGAIADLDAVLATAAGAERIRALAVRGRLRNAARAYDAAIADCSAAQVEAERQRLADPAIRASAHVCIGLARQSRGEFTEAKDSYDAALRFDASDTVALSGRGYVALQRGQYEEAIADFETVLRLDPRSQDALRFLGLAYADRGDLAKADEAIRRAVEVNPRDPWPLMIRAVSQSKEGRRVEALADLERAVALVGRNTTDAHLVRGAVYYFLDDLDKARAELDAAIRLSADNGQAHRIVARILLRQGRLDDAQRSLDLAARLLPGDATVALTRGQLALARRDGAAAVRELSQSLALNAAHAETYSARGQAYELLGNAPLAISDFQTAERKLATDPDGRRALAVARQRLAALSLPAGDGRTQPSRPGSPEATAGLETGPGRDSPPPPAERSVGAAPPSNAYCRLVEGVFVHSRKYTGVDFDVGCGPGR